MHSRPPGRPVPPPASATTGPAPTQRLFVAVPLDQVSLEVVAGLVADLRAGSAADHAGRAGAGGRSGLRWVRPEGVHLTLRFLGPTPRARVPAAIAAVEAAAAGLGPFTVRISGAGAFPRLSAPRVLWLGVAADPGRLADLAACLDERLAAAGWPPQDRPFDAHLTLARANDVHAARPVAAALVRRAAGLRLEWVADRVVLYESWPGPGGSRYEARAVAPLAG
jgi:2'-5' RNA ligase